MWRPNIRLLGGLISCAFVGVAISADADVRFQAPGSICTNDDPVGNGLGVALFSNHDGLTLTESGGVTAVCPVVQSEEGLNHDTFADVDLALHLPGTDTNDVIEGCLTAHAYGTDTWEDCDCDSYVQAGANDYFTLDLDYGGAVGTCDTNASDGWPAVVTVRYSSALSTSETLVVRSVLANDIY